MLWNAPVATLRNHLCAASQRAAQSLHVAVGGGCCKMLPRARAPTRKPAFAVLMHAGGNALRSVCALNAGRKNSRAPAVGGSACARTILIQSLEGSLCDTETTGECKERLETHKCTRRQSRTATMYCRTRCRKISLLVSRHSGIYKIQGAGAVSTGNNTWHIVDHSGLKFRIDNNVLSPVASYSGVKLSLIHI